MTSLKGAEAAPTTRSDVRHRGNAGWPTAGDRYDHGVPGVLVGVATHRGGRESRPQGEGAQASAMGEQGGRRDAEGQNCRAITHVVGGQALESAVRRKVHAAFGEGRTEKDQPTMVGTSPAAYSTYPIHAVRLARTERERQNKVWME